VTGCLRRSTFTGTLHIRDIAEHHTCDLRTNGNNQIFTLDEITLMTKPSADTRGFVSTSSASAEIYSRYEPWPRAPPTNCWGLPGMRYWIGNCCIPASSVQNPITFGMIRQLANAVKLTAIILRCGSGVIEQRPAVQLEVKTGRLRDLWVHPTKSALFVNQHRVLSRPCLFLRQHCIFAA